ncbi:head-tail adaptor protein [Fusobacterium varium]|jgi:head-tail adaptor|uniref:phage head completion protein n=1 Tax=Fusobacterium varium TaxID=856 RepID=UPI001F319FCA|nr:head-tail adaptor protein [Fusobacterium varium]MCF2672897.1 head-tail adaptor protein [Fusobacterium varium]DAE74098.1 MAG TPA: Putative head tail adaptor [Caudoviricetes sp.]
MNNITKRLRHSVEVWHMIDSKNELGENEKIPEKFKNAFSEIVPQNSSVKQGQAETESNEHQFKFTFRRKSVQGIQKDWFFIFEKEKYEVVYFNRDFKDNQFIEVFCKRIEE